ncbi:MAG: rod shape-determining protein MreD [Desulfuromonadaceae bacterium]|nr:rod shape-determining protein MreD [Desulfuromonadaceae bacterium]
MKSLLSCLLSAIILLAIQTGLWPALFPSWASPNFLLLIVLYLGLHSPGGSGMFLSWAQGCLLDVFSGTTFGFHGLVFVLVFGATAAGGRQLNADNILVLPLTALVGTVAFSLLVVLNLLFFSDADQAWPLVLQALPQQLLLNPLTILLLKPLLERLVDEADPPMTASGH